jgi:hypothetical protein
LYPLPRGQASLLPRGNRQQVAQLPLPWHAAFILSISGFHGCGFFDPPGDLGASVAIRATVEADCGHFIESSFIATFTRRFFGSR